MGDLSQNSEDQRGHDRLKRIDCGWTHFGIADHSKQEFGFTDEFRRRMKLTVPASEPLAAEARRSRDRGGIRRNRNL